MYAEKRIATRIGNFEHLTMKVVLLLPANSVPKYALDCVK